MNSKQFSFKPSRFMQIGTCMGLHIVFSACPFSSSFRSSLLIKLVRLLISPIIFTKSFNIFHLIGHLFNDDLYLSLILVHFLSKEGEGNHKKPCVKLAGSPT